MSGLSLEQRISARGLTELVEEIAAEHAVPVADVLGRGRTKAVAAARHAVMRAFRARGLSLPEIGSLLGRDHTTVLHAVSDERRAKSKLGASVRYERERVLGAPLAAAVARGFRDALRRKVG